MRAYVPCFVLLWMVSASPTFGIERNAFLNRVALTTEQLVAQVERDPVVADRFMRHYSMSKDALVSYFSTLKPSVLKTSGQFTIYSCLPSGEIRSRMVTLKPGTRVFVDRNGKPILKMSCGNPLSWRITTVFKEPTSMPLLLEPMVDMMVTMRSTPLFDTAIEEEEGVVAETPVDVALLPPSVPELTFGEWPEVTEAAAPPVLEMPSVPGVDLSFLGSLLVVPFIDFGGTAPLIPEPSTLAAGVVGFTMLLAMRVRRKRG